MADGSHPAAWNVNLERYFADTSEKSNGLGILHKAAEQHYSVRRTFIDLPVIVISGITGFLSAGSVAMFGSEGAAGSIGLGVASLFVSVLNTIGTYFAWGKRTEQHRISSIQYARLHRFIAVELGLSRAERMSPADLLKHVRETYDRLAEISPLIPPTIIERYKKQFEKYDDITLPDELNGLTKVSVNDKALPTPVAAPEGPPKPEVKIRIGV